MVSNTIHKLFWVLIALAMASGTLGCEPEPGTPTTVAAKPSTWQLVFAEQPGAFFSAWGTAATDVWIVGAADPKHIDLGPSVLHFDGKAWKKYPVAAPGVDLWWTSGRPGGDVWFGGTGGTIARWHRATDKIELEATPGKSHIFGVLPVSDSEIWAVGGSASCTQEPCGVVWRSDGKTWAAADVPPALLGATKQWFKAWKHKGILWIVGLQGKLLRYDGAVWTSPASGVDRTLLTIHGNDELCVAVGGSNTGDIAELDASGAWQKVTPSKTFPAVNGVFVPAKGDAVAVGAGAAVARRTGGLWSVDKVAQKALSDLFAFEDFHGVYVDPEGGVWAVGGQFMAQPAVAGQIAYFGPRKIPTAL